MGADADILSLLNSNIRLCVGNIIGQGVTLALLTALRQRKRSLLPLAFYMWIKSIVMMALIDLRIWYGNTELLLLINGAAGVCTAVLSVWITMQTYEGDFATILFSMVGAELVAEAVLQISVLMTNMLEGRPELLTFRTSFQWADIQMLLWGALIFAVVRILLIPTLQGFRKYEVRQKKVVNVIKTVWVIYIILSPLPGMTDFQSGALFFLAKYVITLTVIASSVFFVYLIVNRYQREIRRQREFLNLQKQRMERYYREMQRQIREMEQNQQKMERRMKEILSWQKEKVQDAGRYRKPVVVKQSGELPPNAEDKPDNKCPENGEGQRRTSLYLRELRREYERFRGGMYCNDRLTDAVLCCQKEAAERIGIPVEYVMSGYSRGRIKEEEISRILFYLLDFGIREIGKQTEADSHHISLHAGVVKNQLVFDFFMTCRGDTKSLKMVLREFLKKWNGTMTEILQEQGMRIVILLQSYTTQQGEPENNL